MEQCKFVFGASFVLVVEHFVTQLFFALIPSTYVKIGASLLEFENKKSFHVFVVSRWCRARYHRIEIFYTELK